MHRSRSEQVLHLGLVISFILGICNPAAAVLVIGGIYTYTIGLLLKVIAYVYSALGALDAEFVACVIVCLVLLSIASVAVSNVREKKSTTFIVQPKLDGVRAVMSFSSDMTTRMTTRSLPAQDEPLIEPELETCTIQQEPDAVWEQASPEKSNAEAVQPAPSAAPRLTDPTLSLG